MKKHTLSHFFMLLFLSACINNSIEEDPKIECSNSTLDFSLITTDANCGLTDGKISITATGGEPPYQYSIDGGGTQNEELFQNLSAGSYSITVTDNNGCSKPTDATVGNIDGVLATISVTDSGCGTANGTIMVQATEGTKPYQYQLGGGALQPNSQFTELTAGEYEVTITDALGCDFLILSTIITGISYDTSVKPIIMNNCAISGCHNGSNSLPDWSIFSNVQNNAAGIRSRTQSGSMPKNGSISQAEKDDIACWVDDGAKDN